MNVGKTANRTPHTPREVTPTTVTPTTSTTSTPTTAEPERRESSLTSKILVGIGIAAASLVPVRAHGQSDTASTSLFALQLNSKTITADSSHTDSLSATLAADTVAIRFSGGDSATVSLPAFDSVAVAALKANPASVMSVLTPGLRDAAVLLSPMKLAQRGDSLTVGGAWRVLGEHALNMRRTTHETSVSSLIEHAPSFKLAALDQISAVLHVALAKVVGGSSSTNPIVLSAPHLGATEQLAMIRDGQPLDLRDGAPLSAQTLDHTIATLDGLPAGALLRMTSIDGGGDVLIALTLGEGRAFVPGEGVLAIGDAVNATSQAHGGARLLVTSNTVTPTADTIAL